MVTIQVGGDELEVASGQRRFAIDNRNADAIFYTLRGDKAWLPTRGDNKHFGGR